MTKYMVKKINDDSFGPWIIYTEEKGYMKVHRQCGESRLVHEMNGLARSTKDGAVFQFALND